MKLIKCASDTYEVKRVRHIERTKSVMRDQWVRIAIILSILLSKLTDVHMVQVGRILMAEFSPKAFSCGLFRHSS